jgi:23S rRNA (guanosine2251-2'-O)-methyltransferase
MPPRPPHPSERNKHRTSGRARAPDRRHRKARPPAPETDQILYGIHVLGAALANPDRTIHRLWLTENAERRLADILRGRDFTIERVSPKDLDRRLGADTVHQGAAAEVDPLPERSLDAADMLEAAERGPLLLLDQVTDPHNVGAILRSAAAFGAAGVIMTRRHSPALSATLAKSASGALEQIPIYLVQNLAEAMSALAEAGIRIVGLDGDASDLLEDIALAGPIALALGAEGKGLRERTRGSCHHLCRIGTATALASLNVSNAAAIALHLAAMRRRAHPPQT